MIDRNCETIAAKAVLDEANRIVGSKDRPSENHIKQLISSAFNASLGGNLAGRVAGGHDTLVIVSYYNEPWSINVWETVSSLFFCEYMQKKQEIAARRRGGMHEATVRLVIGRPENREVAAVLAEAVVAESRRVGIALQKELSGLDRGRRSKESMNANRQKGNARTRDCADGIVEFVKSLKDSVSLGAREVYVRESELARAAAAGTVAVAA